MVEEQWLEQADPIPVEELLLAVELLSPYKEATDRGDKRRILQAARVKIVEIFLQYGYDGGWITEWVG